MLARRVSLLALPLAASCGAPASSASPPSAPAAQPCGAAPSAAPAATAGLAFSVSFPASLSSTPLDGRLLLVISKDSGKEPPRAHVGDADDTAQVFGVDVDALAPGKSVVIDGAVLGYPVASLSSLPAGDYVVEAVLHRYETFARGDGHTVKLPPDRGEGQNWTKAPGNLVSAPRRVHLDPARGGQEVLELSQALPELPEVADTKYVKHVRFQSERLTKFWGRPTYLGAIVLLPEGWDTHPNAHYPVVIQHGHFARELSPWRETPPDAGLPPADLSALKRHCPNGHGPDCAKFGYERVTQEAAYSAFKTWTGKAFPRVLLVSIQHANPYYDDSYAVNSENLGPYGDAITYEFLPYLEKQFRGLGPWARGMMGGSTGGWEALAAQIFYPDQYNGVVVNCPDPIDFHAYEAIDIYDDANAYYSEGPFRRTSRPAHRDYLGHVQSTVEQENVEELVLGTHSRSGGQWDIWQAVFSPVADDGYPKPIWDRRTGVIDASVAAYWRDHYDLGHILARDWSRLGPLLRGKISINVGLSDNYFLNDAVYLVDDFLRTANPPADAHVDYGARDEHCWSGDHANLNVFSRLTYVQRFVPALAERWKKSAPKGADLTSWRY
ncbi:MAG TPA: alpha/beta hydrolase-fold protein [Polyangiaceae bacterium]|jgi:hypothetical protein